MTVAETVGDVTAQTSTYLAASLGGDEAAIMAAFEQKIGRAPLGSVAV